MAGAAALAVFVAWPETSTSPPANVGPNIGGDATDAALDRSVAPLTVPQLAAAPVPLDDLALPAVALAEDPVVRASGTTLHLETLAPDRPEAAIAKMLPVPNPLRPIAPVGIENHALTDQELGAVALAAVDVFHRPETAIAQLRSEPAQPLQAFAVDGIRAPLVDAGPMSTVESRIALDANGADVPSHAPLAAPVVTGEVSELTGLSVPADRPAGPSEGLTVMGGDPAGIDSDRLAAIEDALGLSRHSRADIQLRLKLLGFDPQGIDGIFGPRTRAAISGWQRAQGHVPTGYLDAAQRAQIDDTSEGLFLAWQREESALARARAAKVAAVADRERRIAAASRRFGGSRTSPELRGIGPSRPGSGRAGSPREAIGEFVRLFPAILDRIACERGRGRCRRH